MNIRKRITRYTYDCIITNSEKSMHRIIGTYESMTRVELRRILQTEGYTLEYVDCVQTTQTYEMSVEKFLELATPVI